MRLENFHQGYIWGLTFLFRSQDKFFCIHTFSVSNLTASVGAITTHVWKSWKFSMFCAYKGIEQSLRQKQPYFLTDNSTFSLKAEFSNSSPPLHLSRWQNGSDAPLHFGSLLLGPFIVAFNHRTPFCLTNPLHLPFIIPLHLRFLIPLIPPFRNRSPHS